MGRIKKIKKEVALWLILNEKYRKRAATNVVRTTRQLAHRSLFAQPLASRIYTIAHIGTKGNCTTVEKFLSTTPSKQHNSKQFSVNKRL